MGLIELPRAALRTAQAFDAVEFAPGLAAPAFRAAFGRNEEIFGAEEPAELIYRVASGAARTISISADGRRQIMAFHLPGDVVGLEVGPLHRFTAEAIGPCEMAAASRATLIAAAERSPAAAQALLSLYTRRLEEAELHALTLGRKGAAERVAAFLLNFAARQQETGAGDFELPMSRADIADHLGLTIETVSRTFTQMQREGAIDLPNARRVALRDRAALVRLEAA